MYLTTVDNKNVINAINNSPLLLDVMCNDNNSDLVDETNSESLPVVFSLLYCTPQARGTKVNIVAADWL